MEIPRAAAEWIPHQLPYNRWRSATSLSFVEQLQNGGLSILTIKELKVLEVRLSSMHDAVDDEDEVREQRHATGIPCRKKIKLPASTRKQPRVEVLRRALFRDDACSIYNERLLQKMRAETTSRNATIGATTPETPTTTTIATRPSAASTAVAASVATATSAANAASTAAVTSASGSRKRPNHQISHHLSVPHPQITTAEPSSPADLWNAYMYRLAVHQPHPHSLAAQHRYPYPWPGETAIYSNNNSGDNSNNNPQRQRQHEPGYNSAATGTSTETATDSPKHPDSHPQNPTEALLLPQLLQMGFGKQEILDGIRQHRESASSPSTSNTSSTAPPTAEDIMLLLVTQREEAEEARREDEVRLRSEDQKQEESERRERNQKGALAKATTAEELLGIFPESWVLKGLLGANATSNTTTTNTTKSNATCTVTLGGRESRNDFIEILRLEEKSRKWYGWKLPAGYFQKVGSRLRYPEGLSPGGTSISTSTATASSSGGVASYLHDERLKLRSGLYELEEQQNGQPKIFLDERPAQNSDAGREVVVIDDDDD